MGNRSSSHSFSKSKSLSFSDLPYKLENTSYTGRRGARPSSVATTPRQAARSSWQNDELSAQKRTTSAGSLDRRIGQPKLERVPPTRNLSTKSLNNQVSAQRPAQRQSSVTQPTGQRQYNDQYLQSDIKKLFKAHDKSNTKALIHDADDNTEESLDKKLATLKKQRQKDDAVDGANASKNGMMPKKSHKAKKAPSLPTPSTTSKSSVLEIKKTPVAKETIKQKTTTLQKRKSAPAPPPPNNTAPLTVCETNVVSPLPSLLVHPEEVNINNNNDIQQMITPPKGKLIEHEQTETKSIPLSPAKAQSIDHPLLTEAIIPAEKSLRTTVVERELRSTNTLKKKTCETPLVTHNEQNPTANSSLQVELFTNGEDSFIETITKKALEDDKKVEQKEIAIQHNSPIDMAIQCSGETLKEQKQQDDKEKLGNILKLFINKNAEKDAERDPDESSPDADTILADLGFSDAANSDTKSLEGAKKVSESENTTQEEAFGNVTAPQTKFETEIAEPSDEVDTVIISDTVLQHADIETLTHIDHENSNISTHLTAVATKQLDQDLVDEVPNNPTNIDSNNSTPSCEPSLNKCLENIDNPAELLVDVVTEPDKDIAIKIDGTKSTTSPTNSNDSGHDEPSDVSSSTTTGPPHNALDISSPRPDINLSPVLQGVYSSESPSATSSESPGATSSKSPGATSSQLTDHAKDSKKHKSRYSGIFRITKTMRSFMSSISKSSSKSVKVEEHNLEPEDENFTSASDNWVLSGKGGRKPTPRKEYRTTWDTDTFESPDSHLEHELPVSSEADITIDLDMQVTSETRKDEQLVNSRDECNSGDMITKEVAFEHDIINKEETNSDVSEPDHTEDSTTIHDTNSLTESPLGTITELKTTHEHEKSDIAKISTDKTKLCPDIHDTKDSLLIDSEKSDPVIVADRQTDSSEPSHESSVVTDKSSPSRTLMRRNSSIALMTPRGYGAASTTYRPVSNPMVTAASAT